MSLAAKKGGDSWGRAVMRIERDVTINLMCALPILCKCRIYGNTGCSSIYALDSMSTPDELLFQDGLKEVWRGSYYD